MVMVTTERNRNARIGNQTSSETMVPNFFVVKLKKKYGNISMHVIDTPGYGDTYGILRILANGFYHYRLYSKVQNMKFILCIDQSHIRGTCEKFLDTIMKFTSSFKNYLDQK
jgi:GTP-binding protein EngB required for normal cell division